MWDESVRIPARNRRPHAMTYTAPQYFQAPTAPQQPIMHAAWQPFAAPEALPEQPHHVLHLAATAPATHEHRLHVRWNNVIVAIALLAMLVVMPVWTLAAPDRAGKASAERTAPVADMAPAETPTVDAGALRLEFNAATTALNAGKFDEARRLARLIDADAATAAGLDVTALLARIDEREARWTQLGRRASREVKAEQFAAARTTLAKMAAIAPLTKTYATLQQSVLRTLAADALVRRTQKLFAEKKYAAAKLEATKGWTRYKDERFRLLLSRIAAAMDTTSAPAGGGAASPPSVSGNGLPPDLPTNMSPPGGVMPPGTGNGAPSTPNAGGEHDNHDGAVN